MSTPQELAQWGLHGCVNADFWRSQPKALWDYCGVTVSETGEMSYTGKANPPYGQDGSTFPADQAARLNAGMALVAQGVLVNEHIMVFPSDPYVVFQLLCLGGVPYLSNLGGPDAPRNQAITGPYPPNVFPTVLIDESDPLGTLARLAAVYPPINPAAPPPPPPTNVVGRCLGGNVYAIGMGGIVNGQAMFDLNAPVVQNGQTFTPHFSYGMFGLSGYFTLIS